LVQEGNFWFGDLFVDPDSLDERDSSEVKAKMSVECSVEVIRLPVSEDQYGRTEEQ